MMETRERGLAIRLLFTLVVLLTGCGEDEAPPNCAVGQLACGKSCVDPMLDAANCGACGMACPTGATCTLGACKASDGSVVDAIDTMPPTSCPAGEILCGTSCVNSTEDDVNCGTCGNACSAGNVCDLGACRPIGAACPVGRTLCGDVCADLTSSAAHCGQCDTSCGAGSCVASSCSCSPLEQLCGSECVNTAIDPTNCGVCGTMCATGQSCMTGACLCPTGQTLCGDACADLQADPAHCGTCETACATGQLCSAGACLCPTGLDLCDAGCVDLQSTATDCGACGVACTGGKECAMGSCACPTGQTDCDGTCFDLATDAEHCGACDTVCTGGQVCANSSCECPAGETLCDETCTDTMTDAQNCGACGTECTGGQICEGAMCECPAGETLCDETCTDTMTDAQNCGGCGMACTGGQTCQTGSCECPEGQSFCDGQCLDTQTDALNCGGCGMACGLGELCNAGACQGGGLGEDGCEGIAEGITLSRLTVYQTVQIDVMEGGNEVPDRNVDVVAGKNALVRAFVEVDGGFSARELSARLFLDDGTERVTLYTEAPQTISGSSDDEDRDSTFEFEVPGELIRESTRYAVELVECGDAPGATVASPRFPDTEGAELGAVLAGGLRVHIVVLRANGLLPDTSEEALEALREGFLATYPIDSIEFTVSEPYDLQEATAWTYNLESLRYLRDSEGPDPEVYYYGVLKPTENIRDFCGGGCTAGIGYVPNGGGNFAQSGRVSMGLAYNDEESLRTMLHEIGHNHGRNHAPCVPPGASIAGVDPDFPYDNAAIGVWGYDIRSDSLIEPDRPDIMAYCNEPWFSDYTYEGLLNTVRDVNQTQQSLIVDATRTGEFWVLLVDSGTPRWLRPRPGMVTADGLAIPAQVLDGSGAVVANIQVYRNDMADVTAYSLDVPAPEPGWHAIELPGVGRVAF